jgi:mannitol-1-phosphate 5-dehydrogenase
VQRLDSRRDYPLRLVSDRDTQNLTIGNLRALPVSDRDRVVRAIEEADLISTAVGVAALPEIAPLLAEGLARRAAANAAPINLLLCENQWHVGALMHSLLTAHFPADAQHFLESHVGFAETVIARMVPRPDPAALAEDPLLVITEPYQELPIDRDALRAPAPHLPGLVLADNFAAYEARKRLLHNMLHAALAYLGALRGHHSIWQCVDDTEVLSLCAQAGMEVSEALALEYRFERSRLSTYIEDLFTRFSNRALGDTVTRVAADPLRKLRPEDRLIGAAQLCVKQGIAPSAFIPIIQAALGYYDPTDNSSVQLQERRRREGDQAILESLCGLLPGSDLSQRILQSSPIISP